MDSIFHEKQQGQLCAQHCINSLLQGPYFNAVHLSEVASELDEVEKMTMAEGLVDTGQLERIMQQPSSNMDDSGYFSVQVISKALSVWSLSMVPLSSPSMKQAVEQPTAHQAFICHHQQHWFTVRKLGKQWFNLDSLKRQPELISDTYLKLFLAQLQMEGYSIFVVVGSLPSCEADHLLSLVSIQPSPSSTSSGSAMTDHTSKSTEDRRKKKLHSATKDKVEDALETEEEFIFELAAAMSASLTQGDPQTTSGEGFSGCDQDCDGRGQDVGGHGQVVPVDGGQLLAVGGNREAEPMFEAEVTAALHASMEVSDQLERREVEKEEVTWIGSNLEVVKELEPGEENCELGEKRLHFTKFI